MSWPATSLPVVVEAYLGGAWVDLDSLSTGTQVRGNTRVRITYGGTDETPRVLAGSAEFSINDPDNLFSGLNPNAPYFDDLGLNTPIRVSAAAIFRHYGEIGSFKPGADSTERDKFVTVQSRGILSRLTQGNKALRPALERSTGFRTPFAFWPMSDGTAVNNFGNFVAGQLPMTSTGLITPATVAGPAGAPDPLPELVNADVTTSAAGGEGVVLGATGSSWTYDFIHRAVDDGTGTAESTPWSWFTASMKFDIVLSNGGNTITVNATDLDGAGADITLVAAITQPVDSQWHQYRITCSYSSPTTTLTLYRDGVSLDSDSAAGASGNFDHVHPLAEPPAAISALTSSSTGYATVYTGVSVTSTSEAVGGHSGETVVERLTRVAAEESVTLTVIGYDEPTHVMGAQAQAKMADLLQQCADVGQGVLYETADAVGITYRTITDLYNQVPALELDFAQAHLSPPFGPIFDDQKIQNYVTVSRSGGGSTTAVLDDGSRLSISDPPTGVGQYDRGGLTVYCETDTQTSSIAYWRLHLGTYKGYRFGQLTLQQSRDEWTSQAAMTSDLRTLRIGDDIKITNMPERLREVEQLVRLEARGWNEDISRYMWDMVINTIPGWLWEVWELDSGGSTLALAVNSSATSLKLDTSAGPEWNTTAVPYHVQCDGEAMTATAMATATPAFIAAGTAATANNASTTPALPAGITVDAAQLLVIACETDLGTINTPSGWTLLGTKAAASGTLAIFGRYYVTGVTAPAVTYAGGAAGTINIAQMAAWSGVSLRLDDGDYLSTQASPQTASNGSAANITTPALSVRRDNTVVIIAGQRSEDWVSVATLSGFTEIGEPDDGTGNRAGLVWDYQIQTTATDISATSFVVTGGVSGSGMSIALALRPLQTATVTRSVNGVSASHALGDTVKGWRLGVTAL